MEETNGMAKITSKYNAFYNALLPGRDQYSAAMLRCTIPVAEIRHF
jgi:hypothetical protein